MKYADVIINLPTTKLNRIFTYIIPDRLKKDVEFGRRVLVEFGSTSIEAYVIAVKNESSVKNPKSIVHVLDLRPVINEELLDLAYFIADNYLCPVSMVLNAMIPKAITKTKAQVIIPLISKDEYKNNLELQKYESFFNKLFSNNEIKLVDSNKYISNDELSNLASLGVVKIINKYTKKPIRQQGYIYKLVANSIDIDLEKLIKRAPKQAEILQKLGNNPLPCEEIDKAYNKNTINSLLNKGLIVKELVPTTFFESKISLTLEQSKAITTVNNAIGNGYKEFLLFGVTGSGKTEVYINAAQHCIKEGKTVLMLIPEIALTRHLVDVILKRINNIAVLHSNMSNGERLEEWERIISGEVSFVLGTRSAIFAPLPNLGLIIIDEEQESTYKQEETPKYDAREVAQKRALYNNAVLLYGSATPSLDLFYRVQNNEVSMLTLENRIGDAKLPQVHIEDLKNNTIRRAKSIISPNLYNKINNNLLAKEQTILFINRRGYSPTTVCRKCGSILTCPYCSVGVTYHKASNSNICHYCNHSMDLLMNCPTCQSNHLQQVGTGTQRVEEEVKKLFPKAKVERLDLDISRKGAQEEILRKMKNKEIDILIGTQMVAKGLDFPNVSLVGIIDADSMLALPDYRAAERTFQLIVQAAGRAGRGDKLGEVVIQTYSPDNSIITWAAEQDYISFYFEELRQRKILNYPPFSSLLRIVVSSNNEDKVKEKISLIAELINEITDAKEDYLQLLGPAPCPIHKVRSKYRYQIIVKSHNRLLLKSIGQFILSKVNFPNGKIDIDVNPYSMM